MYPLEGGGQKHVPLSTLSTPMGRAGRSAQVFQGWSCRGPQKYRDMIFDIGAEEIGH
jgi:Manganese containing catalase